MDGKRAGSQKEGPGDAAAGYGTMERFMEAYQAFMQQSMASSLAGGGLPSAHPSAALHPAFLGMASMSESQRAAYAMNMMAMSSMANPFWPGAGGDGKAGTSAEQLAAYQAMAMYPGMPFPGMMPMMQYPNLVSPAAKRDKEPTKKQGASPGSRPGASKKQGISPGSRPDIPKSMPMASPGSSSKGLKITSHYENISTSNEAHPAPIDYSNTQNVRTEPGIKSPISSDIPSPSSIRSPLTINVTSPSVKSSPSSPRLASPRMKSPKFGRLGMLDKISQKLQAKATAQEKDGESAKSTFLNASSKSEGIETIINTQPTSAGDTFMATVNHEKLNVDEKEDMVSPKLAASTVQDSVNKQSFKSTANTFMKTDNDEKMSIDKKEDMVSPKLAASTVQNCVNKQQTPIQATAEQNLMNVPGKVENDASEFKDIPKSTVEKQNVNPSEKVFPSTDKAAPTGIDIQETFLQNVKQIQKKAKSSLKQSFKSSANNSGSEQSQLSLKLDHIIQENINTKLKTNADISQDECATDSDKQNLPCLDNQEMTQVAEEPIKKPFKKKGRPAKKAKDVPPKGAAPVAKIKPLRSTSKKPVTPSRRSRRGRVSPGPDALPASVPDSSDGERELLLALTAPRPYDSRTQDSQAEPGSAASSPSRSRDASRDASPVKSVDFSRSLAQDLLESLTGASEECEPCRLKSGPCEEGEHCSKPMVLDNITEKDPKEAPTVYSGDINDEPPEENVTPTVQRKKRGRPAKKTLVTPGRPKLPALIIKKGKVNKPKANVGNRGRKKLVESKEPQSEGRARRTTRAPIDYSEAPPIFLEDYIEENCLTPESFSSSSPEKDPSSPGFSDSEKNSVEDSNKVKKKLKFEDTKSMRNTKHKGGKNAGKPFDEITGVNESVLKKRGRPRRQMISLECKDVDRAALRSKSSKSKFVDVTPNRRAGLRRGRSEPAVEPEVEDEDQDQEITAEQEPDDGEFPPANGANNTEITNDEVENVAHPEPNEEKILTTVSNIVKTPGARRGKKKRGRQKGWNILQRASNAAQTTPELPNQAESPQKVPRVYKVREKGVAPQRKLTRGRPVRSQDSDPPLNDAPDTQSNEHNSEAPTEEDLMDIAETKCEESAGPQHGNKQKGTDKNLNFNENSNGDFRIVKHKKKGKKVVNVAFCDSLSGKEEKNSLSVKIQLKTEGKEELEELQEHTDSVTLDETTGELVTVFKRDDSITEGGMSIIRRDSQSTEEGKGKKKKVPTATLR